MAQEAGVSPSTVSRILNGSAGVAADKKRAVEQAVERLGYRPNMMARHLVQGNSRTVGVLTQDIASPFYNDAIRGIEEGLMPHGYSPLMISGHWHSEQEGHAIELLLGRRVEALIVLGGSVPEAELHDVAARLPVVVLGRRIERPDFSGFSLVLDNFGGARRATTHLIQLGHRTIGHIMGLPEHADAQERLAGYRAALEDHGLPWDSSLVVQGDFREASGLLGMQRLLELDRPLTAVFCSNDQMAYGARLALYRRGIRVPDDLSLVGFDDLPGSSYSTPPLTSVRQPVHDLGRRMAEFVLARLNGQTPALPELELELVVRESTALVRVSPLPRPGPSSVR
ncbi:LacI family DNA-binding transcriptional regulator [Deinococcus sonorensis]|uniref:Substrate-binding domain-containing protein n=1 Tax=Deinococcus sonorensis KR-87 TaxID=694439 RepID=A0AAU7UC94_9DEIO